MFTKTNILLYIFIVIVFLSEIRDSYENPEKSVNRTGKLAKKGQFPFAVRLYSKVRDFTVTYCTAAIITFGKLLTAGHCCHVKGFRIVVSGDPDQTDFVTSLSKSKYIVHHVKKVIVHPRFERTESKLINDLCLLILQKPMSKNEGLDVIRISDERLRDKKNCTALGWGSNFGYEIQHRLYYKHAVGYRCNIRFGNSSKYWFVCLEPHSVCPGDSGGPLVCDGKLYGIASFFIGRGNDSFPRCEEGVVDYYTELYPVKEFIESKEGSGAALRPGLVPCVGGLLVLLRHF